MALFVALVSALLLSSRAAAIGGQADFSQVSRYVFVPHQTVPAVTVIDRYSDEVVGRLATGLIPRQALVSQAAAKLAAADGTGRQIAIVDLASRRSSLFELDFTPTRLLGSTDGYIIAVADLAGGTVAFLQLNRPREVSRLRGLSAIRDLMFGADGAFLYVTADGVDGVGVVDVARGVLIETIKGTRAASVDMMGLTRSPNGRFGYAAAGREGPISVVDLNNFRSLREITVGKGARKAFPTGYGTYLVVPDDAEQTVTLLSAASLTTAAMLKGSAAMATVYSGWLDTVAFVPDGRQARLLVYDLDRLSRGADIVLPSAPAPGAVTSDGAKLYVPLAGTSQVAVIDARTRQVAKTIDIESEGAAAILGKSFDICH